MGAFLMQTLPMWHRQLVSYFSPRLNDSLLRALCYINLEVEYSQGKPDPKAILGPFQVGLFSSGMLESLVNIMVDPIWRRYLNDDLCAKALSDY